MPAAAHPFGDFAHHRQGDEPADLDRKQEYSQDLDEEAVDHQRDAGEQGQPVNPGRPGIGDQDDPLVAREKFGRRIVETKENPAEMPAGKRERTRLQV